jgi:fucose permease
VTTPQTFHRNAPTWLAYLLLAYYGYFLNILGPITPFLKEELRLSYTISSLHFTAFAVGILLVGLGGHLLVRRVGRWRALWIGAFGMAASVALLIAGRAAWLTIGASFLMGLVGSLILVIVPSMLSDMHGERRAVALSEANVIASLVCTAAPLLVGWTAGLPGGWRLALGIGAAVPLLLWFGFGRASTERPDPGQEAVVPSGTSLPTLYWVFWAAIVLAVSVEFCMVFWAADYLEKILHVPRVDAARAVSLFLGGMIFGRMAASRLVQRLQAYAVILASVLVAAGGFAMFWLTGSAAVGMAGLFITGLGVAGLYPLILALAIGTAGGNTVQASARATLASGTAILALPLVLGRLADMTGIRPAYAVVTVLLAGVLLIVGIAGRRQQKSQSG